MAGRRWAFLLDENMEPAVGSYLSSEGYHAEHVQDALSKGAKDHGDVLPYADQNDLFLVTADVSDFSALQPGDHEGLLLLYNQRVSAYEIATGIIEIVEAYGERDRFVTEVLDPWL